jgi:hypothetical protein
MLTTRDCDCSREAIDNWRKTVAHRPRRSRDSFYELARAAQGCGGGVLPLSEAREVSGSETARIHYAARRRRQRAATGSRNPSTAATASDVSELGNKHCFARSSL